MQRIRSPNWFDIIFFSMIGKKSKKKKKERRKEKKQTKF